MTEIMQLPSFREYTQMRLNWRLHYWLLLAVTIVSIPFAVVLWVTLVIIGAAAALYSHLCRIPWKPRRPVP